MLKPLLTERRFIVAVALPPFESSGDGYIVSSPTQLPTNASSFLWPGESLGISMVRSRLSGLWGVGRPDRERSAALLHRRTQPSGAKPTLCSDWITTSASD